MSSISVEITRNLNCYFHLVTTSLPKVAHGDEDEDGDGDNDETMMKIMMRVTMEMMMLRLGNDM